jgi:hypothetical protein
MLKFSWILMVAMWLCIETVRADEPVVLDFRRDLAPEVEPHPILGLGEILGSVFKKASVADEAGSCVNLGSDEEGGDDEVVASVNQVLTGHFSSLQSEQELILLRTTSCMDCEACRWGELILVDGGKVLGALKDFHTDYAALVKDVDGDGLLDVVGISTGGAQGFTYTTAETFTFKGGKVATMPFLNGVVAQDDCGFSEKGKSDASVVTWAGPGKASRFDTYSKRCDQALGPDEIKTFDFKLISHRKIKRDEF